MHFVITLIINYCFLLIMFSICLYRPIRLKELFLAILFHFLFLPSLPPPSFPPLLSILLFSLSSSSPPDSVEPRGVAKKNLGVGFGGLQLYIDFDRMFMNL